MWIVTPSWDWLGHEVDHLDDLQTDRSLDANVPWGYPYTNSYWYSGGYQDWKEGF